MCLTRDEKSREEMTAVGGRSCGKEAGCGDRQWDRAMRSAGPKGGWKTGGGMCEATEERLCCRAHGVTEPAQGPAGLTRGKVSREPCGYPGCPCCNKRKPLYLIEAYHILTAFTFCPHLTLTLTLKLARAGISTCSPASQLLPVSPS